MRRTYLLVRLIRAAAAVPATAAAAFVALLVLGGMLMTRRTLASPPGPSALSRPAAADVVLRGGAVYTVDAVRSWAEAVAIRKDTIVYVGPDRGVTAYVGPRTRVVELNGRMVLPAFQDSHIHPISGGISHNQCALYDSNTKERYVHAVGH